MVAANQIIKPKGDIMKSLQQILKANGQNPKQAYQSGKFKFDKTAGCLVYNKMSTSETKSLPFDKTAGCLVYNPSKVNNYKKEKSNSKESLTEQ
jgi:hypothetical protein